MNKLPMIKEVAQTYNITKRTIRYYEEMGLLTSIKKNDSNYRYYDHRALKRLEQILLLRELNFHLSEIKEILVSEDHEAIDHILSSKLIKLQNDIQRFTSCRNIVTSIIKIKNEKGMEQLSLPQILKEQVYVHKNIERVFEMSQFVGDIILIEFGVGIVEYSKSLIEDIKTLREDIKIKFNKEIPLMRIKDNTDLKDNEYKIIIRGITVAQGLLENITDSEKPSSIINELEKALVYNIENLS